MLSDISNGWFEIHMIEFSTLAIGGVRCGKKEKEKSSHTIHILICCCSEKLDLHSEYCF
jgi:hypothetical protein